MVHCSTHSYRLLPIKNISKSVQCSTHSQGLTRMSNTFKFPWVIASHINWIITRLNWEPNADLTIIFQLNFKEKHPCLPQMLLFPCT